jgi:hypothetical protein
LHLIAAGVPSVHEKLGLKVKSEAIITVEDQGELLGHWGTEFAVPMRAYKVTSFVSD